MISYKHSQVENESYTSESGTFSASTGGSSSLQYSLATAEGGGRGGDGGEREGRRREEQGRDGSQGLDKLRRGACNCT